MFVLSGTPNNQTCIKEQDERERKTDRKRAGKEKRKTGAEKKMWF